jgi:hypothetical protein
MKATVPDTAVCLCNILQKDFHSFRFSLAFHHQHQNQPKFVQQCLLISPDVTAVPTSQIISCDTGLNLGLRSMTARLRRSGRCIPRLNKKYTNNKLTKMEQNEALK